MTRTEKQGLYKSHAQTASGERFSNKVNWSNEPQIYSCIINDSTPSVTVYWGPTYRLDGLIII